MDDEKLSKTARSLFRFLQKEKKQEKKCWKDKWKKKIEFNNQL